MRNIIIIFLGVLAAAHAVSFADLIREEWRAFKVSVFRSSEKGLLGERLSDSCAVFLEKTKKNNNHNNNDGMRIFFQFIFTRKFRAEISFSAIPVRM